MNWRVIENAVGVIIIIREETTDAKLPGNT